MKLFNNSFDSFDAYMIVYSKDNKRKRNYDIVNKLFKKTIKYFEAIDTINNFDMWKHFAIDRGYTTNDYIEKEVIKNGKGKLGCNLSHHLLLEQIYKKYNLLHRKRKEEKKHNNDKINDWFLVLEDDLGIKGNFNPSEFINNIINKINLECSESKYVQLCIYPQFIIHQTKADYLFPITGNGGADAFKKINQYGTCAYLIHIDGIKQLLNLKPWELNIDFLFNSVDQQLNSIAVLNNIFYCKGSCDSQDKNNEMGSLIWDNRHK